MPQANSPAPRHSLRVPPYMGNRGGGAKRVASPDRMDPQAPWIGRRCCAALILSRWNATRLLSAPPAKGSARIEKSELHHIVGLAWSNALGFREAFGVRRQSEAATALSNGLAVAKAPASPAPHTPCRLAMDQLPQPRRPNLLKPKG